MEDPHEVDLGGKDIVRLKSYVCFSRQDEIKVEFHRLSEPAANLIVAKGPTALLRTALGSPALASPSGRASSQRCQLARASTQHACVICVHGRKIADE
jgi:hypothetical protein